MNKVLSILICLALCVSLTACGKDSTNTEPDKNASVTSTEKSDESRFAEDEEITTELKRENGTVYVKSTKHKNHLGYQIIYASDLFTVESGSDFERYNINNTDGYLLMETKPFEKPESVIEKIKSQYTIDTEAETVINGHDWSVFLTSIDEHTAELFVAYQNGTVYTLTVVYPTEDIDLIEPSINDAIFSIVFNE